MQEMAIYTNVEIGILSKVNDLASRYGLEPTDFVAEFKDELAPNPALVGGKPDMTGKSILNYAVLPEEPSKQKQFLQMIDSLGAKDGMLIATDREIMQSLNKALELAPRARPRL